MELTFREKKLLKIYGCSNYHNTLTRLKWLTALTIDPVAKHQTLELARKMETEVDEGWYEDFYHHLHMEMDKYYRIRQSLYVPESDIEEF